MPEADAVPVAASSGTSLFQRDITRPSLRRANHDAHALDRSCLDSDVPPPPPRTASAGGWHAPRTARPVGSGVGIDVKGKGRAVEPHGDSEVNQEREVIVHKVRAASRHDPIELPVIENLWSSGLGPQNRFDRVHRGQVRHHGQSPAVVGAHARITGREHPCHTLTNVPPPPHRA